jgi:hypothetical protein
MGSKSMSGFKDSDFVERRSAAAKARQAALEKFRAAPGPGHPAFAEREAARQAVQAARDVRAAQREIAKKQREVEIAEGVARDAQADRQAAERASRDAAEQAQRAIASEAERKAARDARYAARKARKK